MDHEERLDTRAHRRFRLVRQLVLDAAVHVQGDGVVLLQVRRRLGQGNAIRCGS